MTLGDYMLRYRAKHQITSAELANRLSIHPTRISMIENGWNKKCTFVLFIRIFKLLELTPEELYDVVQTTAKQEAEQEDPPCQM